jgi:hypothetical protein
VLALLWVTQTAALAHLDALPVDSYEAHQWVQSGLIDSVTLEQLTELYNQPLSIPQLGPEGVGALVTRFGRSPGWLPESFASYQPWTPRQQARFWKDFPFLLEFAPLLSFDTQPPALKTTLDFASSFASDGCLDGAQRLCLATQAPKVFRGTINTELSPDSARITKLNVQLTLPRRISLQLGNVSVPGSASLLWGNFRALSAPGYHPGPLLDYCANRSGFRGAQCQLMSGKKVSASLLFHARPLEQGVRGLIGFALPLMLQCELSATAQRIGDGLVWDTLFGGELQVSYENRPLFISLETAVNYQEPSAMPVMVVVKHAGAKNSSLALRYVSIPNRFYAPLGFWRARLNNLLGLDTASAQTCLYQLEGVQSVTPWLVMRTQIDYLVGATQSGLQGSWGMVMSGNDHTLLMSSSLVVHQKSSAEPDMPQRFSARWSWDVGPAVATHLSCSGILTGKKQSLRSEARVQWALSPTIFFSPGLTIRYVTATEPLVWGGGELKMSLFERTWGITRVSWPLQAHTQQEGSIDVAMRFAL